MTIPRRKVDLGKHVPISLLYLGAQLIHEGHEVIVLDRRTFKNDSLFIDTLMHSEADLIGITLFLKVILELMSL